MDLARFMQRHAEHPTCALCFALYNKEKALAEIEVAFALATGATRCDARDGGGDGVAGCALGSHYALLSETSRGFSGTGVASGRGGASFAAPPLSDGGAADDALPSATATPAAAAEGGGGGFASAAAATVAAVKLVHNAHQRHAAAGGSSLAPQSHLHERGLHEVDSTCAVRFPFWRSPRCPMGRVRISMVVERPKGNRSRLESLSLRIALAFPAKRPKPVAWHRELRRHLEWRDRDQRCAAERRAEAAAAMEASISHRALNSADGGGGAAPARERTASANSRGSGDEAFSPVGRRGHWGGAALSRTWRGVSSPPSTAANDAVAPAAADNTRRAMAATDSGEPFLLSHLLEVCTISGDDTCDVKIVFNGDDACDVKIVFNTPRCNSHLWARGFTREVYIWKRRIERGTIALWGAQLEEGRGT